MVAAVVRHKPAGLVPFSPFRHLGGVTRLVRLAFGDELGPEARDILRRMQRMSRWGGLGLWLWGAAPSMVPGFVWLEDGRVAGNVSLRRAYTRGGWMIGNVAVHPDLQGQGIGRALMDAATGLIVQRGGSWAGLEVREDNVAACGLYRGMGFEVVGHSLEMARPEGLEWPKIEADMHWLRRARIADGEAIYRLALEGLSRLQREALEVRRSTYRTGWEARLSARLEGRREDWWVAEEAGEVVAALCLGGRPRACYHSLKLLAPQERQPEFGPRLLDVGLASLSRRPRWETVVELAGRREALEPILAAAGFRRVRRLAQMRKLL